MRFKKIKFRDKEVEKEDKEVKTSYSIKFRRFR